MLANASICASEFWQTLASDLINSSSGCHDLALTLASCWKSRGYLGPSGSGESWFEPRRGKWPARVWRPFFFDDSSFGSSQKEEIVCCDAGAVSLPGP